MFSPLLSFLDTQRDAVIHRQRELTMRPALGPENNGIGESEKALWLMDELARIGTSEITMYPCPDARVPSGVRPNISARVPGKSPQTLWVIRHMDVVPPGEERLWQSPPYTLRVDGDYVYGRGVEDNQQAIVTALLAADALISNAITPDISLGLLFVADEETGMSRGLPHVLKTTPSLIKPNDLVLVPDMGNSDGSMVEIAEKSCLWLRITVTGKQCHASTPDKGINSLVVASDCVLALNELYRRFRNKNPLYTPPWSTFVPSKKEANVENFNTLPGQDIFYLDCRVLPEYDLLEVEKESRRIVHDVAARYKATVAVDVVHKEQAPEQTPLDAPVIVRLLRALGELRAIQGFACGVGGQIVAAPLRHRHIPVAVWATLMPNAHTPNECSRISSTLDDAKIVVRMLFN